MHKKPFSESLCKQLKRAEILSLVYRNVAGLERYICLGDAGMVEDQLNGEWVKRSDVLAICEEALREG